MAAQLGKIYISPGGMQLIVTKGGPGTLSDGDVELLRADAGEKFPAGTAAGAQAVQLGKRYKSADGAVEVLVNKPGPATCATTGSRWSSRKRNRCRPATDVVRGADAAFERTRMAPCGASERDGPAACSMTSRDRGRIAVVTLNRPRAAERVQHGDARRAVRSPARRCATIRRCGR